MTTDSMGQRTRRAIYALGPLPLEADDTIRRSVKGWMGAWGVTRDEMAVGAGMVPRTFYRRLNASGRKQPFTAGEVADMAAWMTSYSGIPVTVTDLYEGSVRTGGPGKPGRSQLPPPDSDREPAGNSPSLWLVAA